MSIKSPLFQNRLTVFCLLFGLFFMSNPSAAQENTQLEMDSTQLSSDKKTTFNISGRIHRTFMLVDDGINTDFFFMDSDQTPTSLKFSIATKPNTVFSIYGNLEVALQSNRPFSIDQNNPNPGTVLRIMASEVIFDHLALGKISLGTGLSSSAIQLDADLSGTSFHRLF